MKIYDCITFFEEEFLFDLRLKILNKYVDYFVVCESIYSHNGEKKGQLFNPDLYKEYEMLPNLSKPSLNKTFKFSL